MFWCRIVMLCVMLCHDDVCVGVSGCEGSGKVDFMILCCLGKP